MNAMNYGPRDSRTGRTRRACQGVGFAVLLSCAHPTFAQQVIRVDASADGKADGTTWEHAYTDLQDALAIAAEGDEIWVAAGTYTPDRGTGDRTLSFDIPSGVALYGGFAGWETRRPQRNWDKNGSILSGDLSGDDGPRDCEQHSDCCYEHAADGCDDAICEEIVCNRVPDCCDSFPGSSWSDANCAALARTECCHLGNWNTCENSFFVVTMNTEETPTILDGFTIQAAYASLRDGLNIYPSGILDRNPGSQISNCLFTNNFRGARSIGGIFTRNTFRNSVDAGLLGTDVTIEDCHFRDNVGGVAMSGVSSVTGCTFEGQTLVAVTSTGDATIDRCRFLDNPGLGYHTTSGIGRVSDCVFSGTGLNSIVASTTTMTLERIAFLGNLQAPLVVIRTVVRAEDCLFSGNRANSGIVGIVEGIAEFDHCTFHGNRASGILRAIHLTHSGASATIRNSIIWGADGDPWGTEDALLVSADTSNLSIDYSIVQGWTGKLGGVGNSGDVPLFVDTIGPDGIVGTADDDLHLLPESPAINSGEPSKFSPDTTDLDGHPRGLCGRVDIGAYEFGLGDYDCDRVIDLYDFQSWPDCMTGPDAGPYDPGCEAFDANADNSLDLSDFAHLQRAFSGPK